MVVLLRFVDAEYSGNFLTSDLRREGKKWKFARLYEGGWALVRLAIDSLIK